MHKKLKTDLMSLAHSILQLKNKEDVFALFEKSKEIHEKLSLLAFVEEYINTTPNLEETRDALISKVEKALEIKANLEKKPLNVEDSKTVLPLLKEEVIDKVAEEVIEEEIPETIEQPLNALKKLINENTPENTYSKNDAKDVGALKAPTLEEELKGTISVDVMANLFENAKPKSLNDHLLTNIQIGLNDRITFVKNLFGGSQEDFNRVVSQLNTFKTEKEAKKFINKMVKPDYKWTEHEELESRFLEIIERRFF